MNAEDRLREIAKRLPKELPESNGHAEPKPQLVPRPLQGTRDTRPALPIRPIEEYQPFPVAALPAPLAALSAEGSRVLQVDPAFIALPGLCVLASLIGSTRMLRLRSDWPEHPILWGITIAESGERKSPAWALATRFLFELQEQYFEDYEQAERTYETEVQKWEVRAKKAREADEVGVWTALGDRPPEPKLRRCIVGDITIEELFEVLADNARGFALTQDELTNWFASLTRYRAGRNCSDLGHYLSIYSGHPIFLDRKTGKRRRLYVPRPAVSIYGSIQPDTLARALTPEFVESGGAARFLLAMPPARLKKWSEEEIKDETVDQYHLLLDGLAKLQPDLSRSKSRKYTPVVLKLGKGAKKRWVEWFNEWAEVQFYSRGAIKAANAKLEAVALRIALVHHVAACVLSGRQSLEVAEQSMQAGVILAKWFAAEARRVYAYVAQSPAEQKACALIDLVENHGGKITVRDLQRGHEHSYPTAEAAREALNQLVDAGFGRWYKVSAGQKGGRPKEEFVLTTKRQNRQNP